MPYHVESAGPGKFEVQDDTGKVVGTHPTRKQALAQLKALYANVPDAKEMTGTPTAVMPHGAGGLMSAPGLEEDEKATGDPGDYLIVEDRNAPTTWHLQVRKNGKPDHGLMGGAWAALHSGYRGNKYEGPNKQEAIGKLKKLYESEDMPVPSEKEAQPSLLDRVIATLTGNKEGRRNSGNDAGRLQQIHDLSVMNGAECPMVFKQANGQHRWVLLSSNAYQDRDKEIISQKSLEADVARTDKEAADYGPLRWWHMGAPDPIERTPGPGADIGVCDFRAMSGRVLIESGTFVNERIGAAIKERADSLAGSIGFFHPTDEPDTEGVYHNIYVFERSLLPRGKASNPLTALTVTKGDQDMATSKQKRDEFAALVGDSMADSIIDRAEQTEKAATDSGLKYKETPVELADTTAKAKVGAEGSPEEEKTEPKKEAEAEGDKPDYEMMAKAIAPHLMKMVEEKMREARKEQTEKEAGIAAQLTTLEAQVKELIGEQPRGLRSGFRASLSEATILKDVQFKDTAQGDPLDSVVDQLMGINRSK